MMLEISLGLLDQTMAVGISLAIRNLEKIKQTRRDKFPSPLVFSPFFNSLSSPDLERARY
jgi:hypothetical protein